VSGLQEIEAGAARAGFAKVKGPRDHQHSVRWQIVCSACDHVETKGWGPRTSPEIMVRNFRRAGWTVGRGIRPLCPSCSSNREAKEVKDTPLVGPSPKIARRVFGLLDDHFDEETRRYRPGYSDERVAKEADTAIELVMRLRREAYGELAEDPKLTELRDELELAKLGFEEAYQEAMEQLRKLGGRVDELARGRKLAG
jgi:hypothetical protein